MRLAVPCVSSPVAVAVAVAADVTMGVPKVCRGSRCGVYRGSCRGLYCVGVFLAKVFIAPPTHLLLQGPAPKTRATDESRPPPALIPSLRLRKPS